MTPALLLAGRYRVDARIGQGGMSEVWQATDVVLDRPVAIKVLASSATSGDDAGVDSTVIRAEAQAAARLAHPNVASVFDYGETDDESGHRIAFIVMELLSGQSLAQRLAQGAIGTGPGLSVMAEVADALAAAHAIGVVHRDVKPGNIMLTPFGAKVFDFGIAASAGETDRGDARGRILGTPSYVAPERLAGARVTPATDMYAYGVLLTRLFEEADHTVPPEIDRLRRRCLAADPDSRPTAAEALALVRSTLPETAIVHNVQTSAAPAPVTVALPPTDYLPPPSVDEPAPIRIRLRRWSLVATAALLVTGGLATLAVAAGHGSRTPAQVTLPQPSQPESEPPPAPKESDPPQASDTDRQADAPSGIAAACESEAKRRNDQLTRLARLTAHGHRPTVTASVVCHDGIPVLQLSR